ncbi:MAG: ABC transporter ATP-binding protein [Thermoplasmata archaeon]|nr:ABC transporter ATP-binding protein [Thermoplasmata archaeon]
MADSILKAKGIRKSFGKKNVLNGLDIELQKGDVYVLFGSNGVGKTTLVKILATLTEQDKGDISHFGMSGEEHTRDIRRKIGFMSHEPYLYRDLTAWENLAFFADLYSIENKEKKIEEMLKMVELYHRSFDRVGSFSRGMKQRLALARTLLHSPELILLDEPYSGLDLNAQNMLNGLIKKMNGQGATFFIITHDIEKGMEIASRGGVLSKGRIIDEDIGKEPEAFKSRYKEILGGEGN